MGATDNVPWPLRRSRLREPEIYDVLQNERRRRTLRCLRHQAGEVCLEELAETLTELECSELSSQDNIRRSVRNSLHQTHLPKLEAVDVVDYDQNSKRVTLTTNAREMDRYLGRHSVYGFSWSEYYRVVATVSLLAILLTELDIWLFAAVNEVLLLTLALGVLAISILYQLWTRRWIYVRSLLD